jgi:hypothetical protein
MDKRRLSAASIATLVSPAIIIFLFSTSPSYEYNKKKEAALVVSFKKSSERMRLCDEKELNAFKQKADKRRKHMQSALRECGSRERLPIRLKVWLDDKETLDKIIYPTGFRNDGITYAYEYFTISAGMHRVKVAAVDYRERENDFSHVIEKEIIFKRRQIVLIDYDRVADQLYLNK